MLTCLLYPIGRALIIDARPRVEFQRLHLIGGIRGIVNLGVEMLDSPDALKRAMVDLGKAAKGRIAGMSGTNGVFSLPKSIARDPLHLYVIGEECSDGLASSVDQSTVVCVLHLLQHGFGCVSIVLGGWNAVKQIVPPNFLAMGEAPPLNAPPVIYQPQKKEVRKDNDDGVTFIVSRTSVGTANV